MPLAQRILIGPSVSCQIPTPGTKERAYLTSGVRSTFHAKVLGQVRWPIPKLVPPLQHRGVQHGTLLHRPAATTVRPLPAHLFLAVIPAPPRQILHHLPEAGQGLVDRTAGVRRRLAW